MTRLFQRESYSLVLGRLRSREGTLRWLPMFRLIPPWMRLTNWEVRGMVVLKSALTLDHGAAMRNMVSHCGTGDGAPRTA